MKLLTCLLVTLFLFTPLITWAGPAEEIAAIGQERARAFVEGNLDKWMEAFADNAVHTSALVPFRSEGKAAIRGHFEDLFQANPQRRFVARQSLTRVYGTDTTVVSNSYLNLHLTDRSGKTTTHYIRTTLTWMKLGGQWRIVDQHVSKMPGMP